MKEIISSLDIGTNEIKLIVGEVYKNEVHVLAVSETKSKGVKNGIIVNPEETLISLKQVFKEAEETLNIAINKVILIVPSYFTTFSVSEGSTTITNEQEKVQPVDLVRTMQASVYNTIPSNRELINITPVEFLINDKEKVKDPKGKKASKLSCKVVLASAPKKNVYTALSLLENLNINVVDICLGSIADYELFRNIETDSNYSALVNIGESKTEVSIFNKGVLIETETLEIGGRNIDRDICYIYDVPKKTARELKEKFALASKRNASSSETVDVKNKNEEIIKINQYEISEIISSRLKEIIDLIKKQINLLTKKEIRYIIITGGVASINDFELILDENLGKDYILGKVNTVGCRHSKYSSCLGLIKYYHNKLSFRDKLAYTVDEEYQQDILNSKKNNKNDFFAKIHGYFFDN